MRFGDPISPEIACRTRASFARQGLMAHPGAGMTEIRAGQVTLRLPFRSELMRQHGLFHTGGRCNFLTLPRRYLICPRHPGTPPLAGRPALPEDTPLR